MTTRDPDRRWVSAVRRDEQALRLIRQSPRSLADLTRLMKCPRSQTYWAVDRLRQRGLVEKVHTGTRTPIYRLVKPVAEAAS